MRFGPIIRIKKLYEYDMNIRHTLSQTFGVWIFGVHFQTFVVHKVKVKVKGPIFNHLRPFLDFQVFSNVQNLKMIQRDIKVSHL